MAVDSHVDSSKTTDKNRPIPSRGCTYHSRINVLPPEAYLHGNLTFTSDTDWNSLSLTDFNIALSFVTEEYAMTSAYANRLCSFSTDFKAVEAFALLTDNAESMYSPKTPKDLWFHLHVACQVDPLDAQCLDSMELFLGTPSSFCFVPPGVRSAPAEFYGNIRMKCPLKSNLR
ncbi:hypothetical protein J1N35_018769 [Gossypium stocksii]|uniref:Uncharacterized protein n=1 Tax=Gossypium stocksii TaxID=47602 RepID=A0A9D3VQY7_9ROSI|nr:hypothetical protein J1N35_018769 [Gossypium stocksii]